MVETLIKYFERMHGKAITINVEKPFVCGLDIPSLWFGLNTENLIFEDEDNRTQPFALEIKSIDSAEFYGNEVTITGCGYIVKIAEA